MKPMKFASGLSTGTYHNRRGLPCQDAIASSYEHGVAVIALADGAGSKRSSQIGAQIAVDKCTAVLTQEFSRLIDMESQAIAEYLYHKIIKEFPPFYPLEEMASTLLFAAVREDQLLAGHVGDGLIAMYLPVEGAAVLSYPHNGAFHNETYFLTDLETMEHMDYLRIYKRDWQQGQGILLMSDGATDSLYDHRTKTLANATQQVFEWLEEQEAQIVSQALQQNIQAVMSRKSHDDISVNMMLEPIIR